MVEAYCVKCKKKGQKMKDAQMTQTARGGFMAKGKCPVCGTVMCDSSITMSKSFGK